MPRCATVICRYLEFGSYPWVPVVSTSGPWGLSGPESRRVRYIVYILHSIVEWNPTCQACLTYTTSYLPTEVHSPALPRQSSTIVLKYTTGGAITTSQVPDTRCSLLRASPGVPGLLGSTR